MKILLAILLLAAPCFGQGQWSTVNADALIQMNTSSPGTTFTTAIGNAGVVSNVCTPGAAGCNFTGTVTGLEVGANQGVCSNLGPIQMNGGGSLLSAESQNYNNIGHLDSSNGTLGVLMNVGGAASSHYVQLTGCLTFSIPFQNGGFDNDMIMMLESGGSNEYFDMQFADYCGGVGEPGVRIENRAVSPHSACIGLPFGTGSAGGGSTYYFALTWDMTNGIGLLYIFTPQGTLVGSTWLTEPTTTTYAYSRVFSNEGGSNSGTYSYYQNMMLAWSNSAPTGTVNVVNGSATVVRASGSTFVAGNQWGQSGWGGWMLIGGVMYQIAYCADTTHCTMTSTYAGTTASGVTEYIELPLFWGQSDTSSYILPANRTGNWTSVGVSGGIPSGSWSQCVTTACRTVTTNGSSSTQTQIQSALSSASGSKTYVLLPSGTYTVPVCMNGYSNTALRGAGADQTFLVPAAGTSSCGNSAAIGLIATDSNTAASPDNLTTVTGMLQQGSNQITLTAGGSLTVGGFLVLDQLDTTSDNGGILVSGSTSSGSSATPGNNGPYNVSGSNANGNRNGSCVSTSPANCYHQQQYVTITSCNGTTTVGASCSGSNVVVGINPPLLMPNWTSASTMSAWGPTSPVSYVGIEDLSVDASNVGGGLCGGQTGIFIRNAQNWWIKGVRILNSNQSHIHYETSTNGSILNNYLFLTNKTATCSYGTESWGSGNTLVVNNIFHGVASPMIVDGPSNNEVFAYNFSVNNYFNTATYNQNGEGDHGASDTMLLEGNITNWSTGDDIHATSNRNTHFRNLYYGAQPSCYSSGLSYAAASYGSCANPTAAVQLTAYHRFYSYIGNILQNVNASTVYSTAASGTSMVVQLGLFNNSSVNADPNTSSTAMFWGNADNVTGYGSPRFNCSEIQQFPSNTTANANLYTSQFFLSTPCPGNHVLPSSFIYTATPSWWPSGKAWPIIGPDITGGNLLTCTGGAQTRALVTNSSQCPSGSTASAFSGLAYSNPAMDCYLGPMSGPADGVTTAALTFNEASCYGAIVGPPAPFPAIFAGSTIIGSNSLAQNQEIKNEEAIHPRMSSR
jgi:hypothetical protein